MRVNNVITVKLLCFMVAVTFVLICLDSVINTWRDCSLKIIEVPSDQLNDPISGIIQDDPDASLNQLTETNLNNRNISTIRGSRRVCKPEKLPGVLNISDRVPLLKEIALKHQQLSLGGHYRPPDCIPREKVAIVLPYRGRNIHLRIFLNHIHPFLQRQKLEYQIFVIEQDDQRSFNRARLFNIGFLESLKLNNFDCTIFHDVDLLPMDDRNQYNCPQKPRHMSVAVDKFEYKLYYSTIFGGVIAMTTEQFRLVNGFSNSYWGWGGEDDDMYKRVVSHKLEITRPSAKVGRYRMIQHKQQKINAQRFKLLEKAKSRFDSDGVSSVQYVVHQIVYHRLFILISV